MAKKKLKIAFLNISQGAVDRGAETFVVELSKRLGKSHEVIVISGNRKPGRRWPIVWRIYLDPHSISIALFTLKVLPKIWRSKYNIVVPLNSGWQPAIIRVLTWAIGGKMVISGQSGKGWDDRVNLFCFPNCFVAISPFLEKWAKRVNPFTKVLYIPNGVDIKKFKSKGKKYKTSLKKPIVLCVGALTKDKRIKLAIKATSKLKNASLLVVGDGPKRKEIEKLGQRLLKDRFELISVPFLKMPEVYRSADVLTFPTSPWESFGIVMVEAMASGLPVVATDDPIRRHIVGKAGLFVNPKRTRKYAKALEKALAIKWEDQPRRQAEKFTWDKIAKEYERIFIDEE